MRNDNKGNTVASSGAKVFYASGERGDHKHGNGAGGLLARGYWRLQGLSLKGPFTTRNAAEW